ncbi:hypothetical protein HYH03_018909, partial [Edaphochlamys debaryana]
PNCDCSKLQAVADGVACPAMQVSLYFKAGDRYDDSIPAVRVCVPTIGYDPLNKIYKIAFCWSTLCPALAGLAPALEAGGTGMRAYAGPIALAPAVGPAGLAGSSVVLSTLNPACATPSNTLVMKAGSAPPPPPPEYYDYGSDFETPVNGSEVVGAGGTFSFGGSGQRLVAIPPAGVDTLDVDVRIGAGCDGEWVVVAMVEVSDTGGTTPPLPPAACPCWMRAEAGGTCPGIKVPILLETLDAPSGRQTSIMQCIDPANYDIYTGRMAYSYCWRYSCIPDVFATSTFTATCTDLERWNIAKMEGKFKLGMQHSEGVRMHVVGKPKNPALPLMQLEEKNDQDWIDIPEGGVGNFTFVYTIAPGLDDLSAAVVMDASPRPPPPPSPPGPPGTSCACPLLPEQTNGGDATRCNSTYATMKLRLDDDPSVEHLQCTSWPNYDLIMREMAWSYCWRYDCLPPTFIGKSYTAAIENVTKHNIQLIPPAGYKLLTLVAPYGMYITVDFELRDGTAFTRNSTVGRRVVSGREQNVTLNQPLDHINITYHIPKVWGIDGMAAATVLRYIDGSEFPRPPSPPPAPPRPPAPPPLPPAAPRLLVTADFLVLAAVPLSSLLPNVSGASLAGYTVSIPIKFYDFTALPDCSDASVNAFKALAVRAFNITDASTVSISCRFSAPTSDLPVLRRVLRAIARLLQAGTTNSTAIEATLTLPIDPTGTASPPPSDAAPPPPLGRTMSPPMPPAPAPPPPLSSGYVDGAMSSGCEAMKELAPRLDCTLDAGVIMRPRIKVVAEQPLPEDADPVAAAQAACSSGTVLSDAEAQIRAAAEAAGQPLSDSAVVTVGCRAVVVRSGVQAASSEDVPSDSGSSGGLSDGAIAGIVIGAVAGTVLLAVVALMAYNKFGHATATEVVDPARAPRSSMWDSLRMHREPSRGDAPTARQTGVSTYT